MVIEKNKHLMEKKKKHLFAKNYCKVRVVVDCL